MAFMTSKGLYVIISIGIILTILYFAGRKTFHAEILIPAPSEDVWDVLTDVDNYQHWNPLLIPTTGEFKAGSKIIYKMSQPNGKQSEFETTVVTVQPLGLIKQHAGIPMVLTADHEYRLIPENGGTRVIQHEVDNGFAMLFWDSSWVQPTYEKVNEALRNRVLALHDDKKRSK